MRYDRISTDRCLLGECPLWCDQREVYWWVDVLEGALWSFDPSSGDCRRHPVKARRLGSIALYDDATLLLACDDGLHHFDPDSGVQAFWTDPDPSGPEFRKNDGRVDTFGNFWVGTLREHDYAPLGKLFRVTPEGEFHIEAEGLSIPNGLAFDAARRRVYFADTRAFTIWAADQADDGRAINTRVFAKTSAPARPDGSCLDRDGRLWNALYAGGRMTCFLPDGTVAAEITLPMSHPTCGCFGGSGLDRLCITSASHPLLAEDMAQEPEAGHVILVDVGAGGLPENRLSRGTSVVSGHPRAAPLSR